MCGGPGPRATFGGGGRPYVANGPHSFCGAYRIVGGGLNPYLPSLKETDTTRSVHDGAGVSGAWRSPASTVRLKVPARRGSDLHGEGKRYD